MLKRILSLITARPPLYYGVAVVIVATVCYGFVDFLPKIQRDLQLLHEIAAVDARGLVLEGELQHSTQEGRTHFLAALLTAGNPEATREQLQQMQIEDDMIARTESQLANLGGEATPAQRNFHAAWMGYITERGIVLDAFVQGGLDAAQRADKMLGNGPFILVQQQVELGAAAMEVSADRRITEASKVLQMAKRELLVMAGVKLAVLLVLLWMEWKRRRTVAQLWQTSRQLQASEERFGKAFDSAVVGMGIFALDGTVLSVNRTGARMLGCEPAELIGTKVRDFMAPEFREDHLNQIKTLPLGTDSSYVAERRVLRKDGTTAWVRNSVTLMRPDGAESYFFSISEEITAQKEAHQRLEWLANYDPVTGLPNRRYFEEQLAAALEESGTRGEGVALLYLEIDSFDFLKGTFGRGTADEILGEVGVRLRAFEQETDLVARLDDHVFGMLVRAAPYDEATLQRAGELRELVHGAGEFAAHRIPISASIGVAYSSEAPGSRSSARTTRISTEGGEYGGARAAADSLMKYARAAMLEARSRGGDSIYVADPALQERAEQRHRIESALVRGLRLDEFRVVYQPQFEVATGRLVRFEALCRWHSAELGTIPPDRFIPIAEQTGMITEIGRRILHESLREASNWTQSGRRIGVAVNISPMQFMRPHFTQTITEALALTQFPPALLELEITEGIFIRDLNVAVARIRELQRLGLSIALDDFGTGYSSLSYLQRMPIDAVKLDRSFVSDLTTDEATVSMVRSVLAMADALSLRVVTEGVETEAQLEILRRLGCDEAQGYLLGRPESAELALRRVLDSPLQPVGART